MRVYAFVGEDGGGVMVPAAMYRSLNEMVDEWTSGVRVCCDGETWTPPKTTWWSWLKTIRHPHTPAVIECLNPTDTFVEFMELELPAGTTAIDLHVCNDVLKVEPYEGTNNPHVTLVTSIRVERREEDA